MDKILRWYIDGNISRTKTEVGGTYILDDDYVPEWVHITCRIAGVGSTPMLIDINDDDVSIFEDRPALTENQTEKKWTTIPANALRENSIIKLDIDQIFNEDTCRDLTVQLGLRRA
jgi:hypothetical protein